MKRLFKAILKAVIFLIAIILLNFILDLIIGIASWIRPVLSILAIIALITFYYIEDKFKEGNQ